MLPTIRTIMALALSFVTGPSRALELQTLKSHWTQEVIIPRELTFIQSENYPSYAVLENDEDVRNKFNVSLQSVSEGRTKYACSLPIDAYPWPPLYNYRLMSLDDDREALAFDTLTNSELLLHLLIVDMKTCGLTPWIINSTVRNIIYITAYKDSVDVFLTSFGRSESVPYKLRFNITSKQWGYLENFPIAAQACRNEVNSILHLANGTRYLLGCTNDQNRTLIAADVADDKIVNILEKSSDPFFYHYTQSNNYGDFSLCDSKRQTKKMNCTRMDSQLMSKLKVELEVDEKLYHTKVYNLKNGGLLLFLVYADILKNYEMLVEKQEVGQDGSGITRKELARIDCVPHGADFVTIYEENDSICVRFTCFAPRLKVAQMFDIIVKCF